MKLLTLFFFFLPITLFAQKSISGHIYDADTKLPIHYATIYINHTHKGATTNSSGFFELKNIPNQAQLVVSHVGYIPQFTTYNLSSDSTIALNIFLTSSVVELQEIEITDKNKRTKNLTYFHKAFFGANKWGDYSFVENDSVLHFETSNYDSINHNNDGNPDIFIVKASAPLKVDLPLLGYKTHINIFNLSVVYNHEIDQYITKIKAAYYYQAFTPRTNYQKNKIRKNRLSAYYNSREHFIESLYKNELHKNGYQIFENVWDEEQKRKIYTKLNIDNFIIAKNNYQILTGLKNRELRIAYHKNPNGYPIDLTSDTSDRTIILTPIHVLTDSCIILPNRTILNNTIIFEPSMGNKKIGAILPYDYKPQVKRITRRNP